MRRALITGITGQDGSFMADLLLEKGYEVHGLVRRSSLPNHERIAHLVGSDPSKIIFLHCGDLLDQTSLERAVYESQPHEVYHLAAQSFVGVSWSQPMLTVEVTGLGTLRMLEAIRLHAPEARFYQASSSEMFGNAPTPLQHEGTPFRPCSPYGAAKVLAHNVAVNYRESYGMYICCGILYNHESERRGSEFVTRKISIQVAECYHGLRDQVELGNMMARRDWGHAKDYMEAAWLMLQQDGPDDYVIATGETHSVADFLSNALRVAGLSERTVVIDPSMIRPAELRYLRGDASKARTRLGWVPNTGFGELVRRMVEHDLHEVGKRGDHERDQALVGRADVPA